MSIFLRIKPDTESNTTIREEAWAVLRNLFDQADKFFFGEGAALPPDYRPPAAKS